MSEESVIVTRKDGVAIVRLNEPKTMNAMSAGIKAGMDANIPVLLEDDAVRCILITGTGEAFCAGGDIRNASSQVPSARSRTALRPRDAASRARDSHATALVDHSARSVSILFGATYWTASKTA
jgi:enoyl-CoA hydratase/carnithine racemase